MEEAARRYTTSKEGLGKSSRTTLDVQTFSTSFLVHVPKFNVPCSSYFSRFTELRRFHPPDGHRLQNVSLPFVTIIMCSHRKRRDFFKVNVQTRSVAINAEFFQASSFVRCIFGSREFRLWFKYFNFFTLTSLGANQLSSCSARHHCPAVFESEQDRDKVIVAVCGHPELFTKTYYEYRNRREQNHEHEGVRCSDVCGMSTTSKKQN